MKPLNQMQEIFISGGISGGTCNDRQCMKKPMSNSTSVFMGSKSTPGRIRTSNPRFRRPRER